MSSGKNKQLPAKLKQEISYLLAVHCRELCMKKKSKCDAASHKDKVVVHILAKKEWSMCSTACSGFHVASSQGF